MNFFTIYGSKSSKYTKFYSIRSKDNVIIDYFEMQIWNANLDIFKHKRELDVLIAT